MPSRPLSDEAKIMHLGSSHIQEQLLNDNNKEIADQPRIEEEVAGPYFARPAAFYLPTVKGKWWSIPKEDFEALNEVARRNHTMVGRIMETTWSVQLYGDERCDYCKKKGYECWTFKPETAARIRNVGTRCARCRAHRKSGSCTLTKTFLSAKDFPSVAPSLTDAKGSKSSTEQGGPIGKLLQSRQGMCEDDLNALTKFGITEEDLQLTVDEQRAFKDGTFGNVEGLIATPEFAEYFSPPLGDLAQR